MGLGQAWGWSKVLFWETQSWECVQDVQTAPHAHNHAQLALEMVMGLAIPSWENISPEALISGT